MKARICVKSALGRIIGIVAAMALGSSCAYAGKFTGRKAAEDSRYLQLLIHRSKTLYMHDRLARTALPASGMDAATGTVPGSATAAPYADYVRAASRAAQVDAALIHAVILVESGYDSAARSEKGALGLMQLMPETAKRYGVTDRLDPAQNIQGGARYLRDLQKLFNNDLRLVLAAYNAGESAVAKYGNTIPPFAETIAYVPRVMKQYMRYRQLHPAGRH